MLKRQPFEQRLTQLKNEAQSWLPNWRELQKYILPTRGQFYDEQPNFGKTADYKALLDSTSTRSARTLASGMTSGLTSPSRPWFKIGIADDGLMQSENVKLWLDAVQKRIMGAFSKSNIYGALYSIYEEIGTFGTASMIILEDQTDIIRARTFTIGEYYIGTGHDGRVNAWGRETWKTAGQMVKEFGPENVSYAVKAAYDNGNVDTWFKCFHLIEENDDRIPGRQDFKNMPFRSVYWEAAAEDGKFLRYSGYEEFPVLSPRWNTTRSVDNYGRSPGWDALGDIRMLQKMQKDKLIALDKMVDPPVVGSASIQGEINTLPGGVSRDTAQSGNGGVRPVYQVNPDLKSLEFSIEQAQKAINSTFYADLFMMIAQSDRADMTAREVVERHEEKLLMLGPVLERLENELLDPLIARTFSIMARMNLLPEPPRELQGMPLKVEYISMLAQAQKMVGTTSIEQAVRFVGNLAGANQQVLDVIDFDEATKQYAEMLGVPPKIVRSDDEIAAIREQRAQAAQAQAQQQQAASMVQGAQVLANTPVGQNSALDQILGTTGESGGQG